MGSVSERRPAKMGGEILTGKPGSAGLRAAQLGGGMIEKNKNLIKKHLKMPSRISSLQIQGNGKANDGNLAVVKEEPNRQLDENWESELSEDVL